MFIKLFYKIIHFTRQFISISWETVLFWYTSWTHPMYKDGFVTTDAYELMNLTSKRLLEFYRSGSKERSHCVTISQSLVSNDIRRIPVGILAPGCKFDELGIWPEGGEGCRSFGPPNPRYRYKHGYTDGHITHKHRYTWTAYSVIQNSFKF